MKKLMIMLLIIGLYHFPISIIYATESEAVLFLEKQLACILPPSPLKTIHRLASEGLRWSPKPEQVECLNKL